MRHNNAIDSEILMKKISAFVAHGFLDSDKVVWNYIESQLRAIKTTGKWFDFEDGEPSEDKSIGDKVRERIDIHPIFIGLFTRRQLLGSQQVSDAFSYRFASAFRDLFSAPAYSTSNWVIQESGYAIAKKKHLIFMVENGVHEFPQLQNNLEIIFFRRDQIDGAVTKLMQMLVGVQAQCAGEEGTPAMNEMESSTANSKETPGNPIIHNDPKDELFNKVLKKVLDKDIIGGRAIIDSLPDNDERVELEAFYYFMAFQIGEQSAIQSLMDLAKSNPKLPFPQRRLGQIREQLKDYINAAETFKIAADLTIDPAIKISRICDAALSYAHAKKITDATELLKNILKRTSDITTKCKLFKTLGDIAKIENQKHIATAYWEKALELNPFDTDIRFSIAYQYSELGLNYLSIFHYKNYSVQKENPGVYNNLGVAYGSIKLPGKANKYYRQATEKHETLAMSNLANNYMNAGFLEDARKLIQDAQKEENISDNIGKSLARLAELGNEENAKNEEIEAQAMQQRDFQIAYCDALISENITPAFAGTWEFRHGIIPLTISEKHIYGQAEIKSFGLAALMANTQNETIRTLDFSGEITNGGISYKIKFSSPNTRETLLSAASTLQEFTGYAFINESGIMEVLEIDNNGTVALFKATKKS